MAFRGEEADLRSIDMDSPPRQPRDARAPLGAWPVVLAIAALLVVGLLAGGSEQSRTPSYTEFLAQIEARRVEAVTIKPEDNTIEVKTRLGQTYKTAYPANTEEALLAKLDSQRVAIDVEPKADGWGGYLIISCRWLC